MIKVLFFARLREQLGRSEMEVACSESVATLADLQRLLIDQGGAPWGEVLGADNVLRAVNQEEAELNRKLSDGDEVAFFPPVTGG